MQYIHVDALNLMSEEAYWEELDRPTGINLEEYVEWGYDMEVKLYVINRLDCLCEECDTEFNGRAFSEDQERRDELLDMVTLIKRKKVMLLAAWVTK